MNDNTPTDESSIGRGAFTERELARLDDQDRRTVVALVDVCQMHFSDFTDRPRRGA